MNEGLEKFRELLLKDETFQKELKTAAEAYTGELTEKAVFDNVIVPLAGKYGITATFDEFKEYIDSLSDQQLSPDEIAMVAGGDKGFGMGVNACFALGVGGGATKGTVCIGVGIGGGAGACAYEGQAIQLE